LPGDAGREAFQAADDAAAEAYRIRHVAEHEFDRGESGIDLAIEFRHVGRSREAYGFVAGQSRNALVFLDHAASPLLAMTFH
jgi:hypothetical protein